MPAKRALGKLQNTSKAPQAPSEPQNATRTRRLEGIRKKRMEHQAINEGNSPAVKTLSASDDWVADWDSALRHWEARAREVADYRESDVSMDVGYIEDVDIQGNQAIVVEHSFPEGDELERHWAFINAALWPQPGEWQFINAALSLGPGEEALHNSMQRQADRFMEQWACHAAGNMNNNYKNMGIGSTDGERAEREWSSMTPYSSTKEMGPGRRRSRLDDACERCNKAKTALRYHQGR
ncbi:hypothetical protein B0H10DRAFT_526536 [Mycena sp. CBHHK59/15]|nr:hypothetical protein B0H10DRAFT_526536 [Mycena sp. CBHHK59/15]